MGCTRFATASRGSERGRLSVDEPPVPSSLPMMAHRLSASTSFVLAALRAPGVLSVLSALESGRWVDDTNPASTGLQSGVPNRLIGLCAMLPDAVAAPALTVLASRTESIIASHDWLTPGKAAS